jgi:hypothetical protein
LASPTADRFSSDPVGWFIALIEEGGVAVFDQTYLVRNIAVGGTTIHLRLRGNPGEAGAGAELRRCCAQRNRGP